MHRLDNSTGHQVLSPQCLLRVGWDGNDLLLGCHSSVAAPWRQRSNSEM